MNQNSQLGQLSLPQLQQLHEKIVSHLSFTNDFSFPVFVLSSSFQLVAVNEKAKSLNLIDSYSAGTPLGRSWLFQFTSTEISLLNYSIAERSEISVTKASPDKTQIFELLFSFLTIDDTTLLVCRIPVKRPSTLIEATEITEKTGVYKNLVDRISDGFIALDNHWNFVYANPKAAGMFGKDDDYLRGRNIWDVFPAAVGNSFYRAYHRSMDTQQHVHFIDFSPYSQRWLDVNVYPSTSGLTIYFRDITDQVNAENAKAKSDATRKQIMDAALDAIICIDAAGNIAIWNHRAEQLFGWTAKEAVGKRLIDTIIPEKYTELHVKGLHRYHQTGKGMLIKRLVETEAVNKQGHEFSVELFIVPVTINEDHFYCAFIRDISERKRSEKMLEKNRLRLEQAQHTAHLGHWDVDLVTNVAEWSVEACRIYGLPEDKRNYTDEEWLSFVHPDDLEHVKRKVAENIMNLTGEGFFFRIIRTDGEIRHLYTESKFEFNAEGIPTGLYGIVHDITPLKKLEQDLQEQQRKEQLTLTSAILQAQEKERNLIGEELHDNVNQILVSTKLLLSSYKTSIPSKELIDLAIVNLQEAIQENRKIAHELVAPDFYIESLSDQLRRLCNGMFSHGVTSYNIDISHFDETRLLEPIKLSLYRICQEQCTNIVKYAAASSVEITLSTEKNLCTLLIKDNGVGMNVSKKSEGIGLRNIRGRTAVHNGHLNITSKPGAGFELAVTIPLEAAWARN